MRVTYVSEEVRGYIQDTFQDTMYLNPQIHDTQDTLTIHVGYITDT